MTSTRPILRYHGGKWRLAPWVIEQMPAHRVYVEPFAGGASVLLRKERSYAEVYNDLDGEVVNVFRVLRDPQTAAGLRMALSLTPYSRDEFNAAYEPTEDPVERARRTLIRSHMGFGSAAFNSAHGTGMRTYTGGNRGRLPSKDWANLPIQIAAYCERLAGIVIENRDAFEVMRTHDAPDVLHYVDPPYVLSTRGCASGVRQKYRHELTDEKHRELAQVLKSLQGMVLLSGYSCDLYEELFGDWERIDRPAMADGANPRTECLWINGAAAAGKTQKVMFA